MCINPCIRRNDFWERLDPSGCWKERQKKTEKTFPYHVSSGFICNLRLAKMNGYVTYGKPRMYYVTSFMWTGVGKGFFPTGICIRAFLIYVYETETQADVRKVKATSSKWLHKIKPNEDSVFMTKKQIARIRFYCRSIYRMCTPNDIVKWLRFHLIKISYRLTTKSTTFFALK